jgi:hypothetical protein
MTRERKSLCYLQVIGDETFDEFLEKLLGEFGSISVGLSAGE